MKWLRALFLRKPPPALVNWRVGDVAECIADGPWVSVVHGRKSSGPQGGQRAIVLQVRTFPFGLFLRLSGWPDRFYEAVHFRKIVPTAADRTRVASATPPAGSGSRPDVTTPLPVPSEPALEPAGVSQHQPETPYA